MQKKYLKSLKHYSKYIENFKKVQFFTVSSHKNQELEKW